MAKRVFRVVGTLSLVLLTACASQTRKTVDSLDKSQPEHGTAVCQNAQRLAPLHDDIKRTRSVATPGALLLLGAPVLLPVLAVNMGLDGMDRLDASKVAQACGGQPTPVDHVIERVVLGAGFDLFTGQMATGR